MRMKNSSSLIVVVLILIGLSITACDKRSDVTRESLSFEGINTEQMLGGEDTKELSKLIGNLTFGQVLDLLGNSLKTLNTLAEQGYTTKEDYQTLLNIIKNTYTYLLEQKAEYDADPEEYNKTHPESSNSMSTLLKMAVDAKVGVLFNQVIKQADSQCITKNIYPMIAYALNADDNILKNLFGSGSSSTTVDKITLDEFNNLLVFVNNIVNENGSYYKLHESISTFRTTLETEPNPVTVDDVKFLYDSLNTLAGPYNSPPAEETPPGPYTTEQSNQIWDKAGVVLKDILKNNSGVHRNINDMSKALNLYITSDDFKATLEGLEATLATNPTNPETLKNFVTKALVGLVPSSGSEYMAYMAPYLANINLNDIDGIAKGLNGAFGTDWYTKSGPNTLNVKTSGLRALMFMMQEAGNPNNVLNKLQIINLMSSTDDNNRSWKPSNWYTNNVAMWTIGEVVHALYEKNGDPLTAIDYVLYQKPYDLAAFSVAGIPIKPKSYIGMNAMMTDTMMDMFREKTLVMNTLQLFDKNIQGVDGILDPFPAFKELAGGDGKTAGTAGNRHSLIALFAPLMQSAWEKDIENFKQKNDMTKTFGTVDMMAQINEISHAYYAPLKDSNSTFVKDDQGVVIKTAEPALKMALKDRSSTGNTDPGLVAPLLKLAITVVFNLNETDCPVVKDQKLLVSIIKDLNMQQMTIEDQGELIAKLFSDKNEENQKPLIENVNLFLTEKSEVTGKTNITNIADFAKVMGKAMDKSDVVGSLVGLLPTLIVDYDTKVSPVISKLLPESTSTDDTSTFTELMDYLTAKINNENNEKEDNDFVVNGWRLIYKVLDVQDDFYNSDGFIKTTKPITGPDSLLLHLSELYQVKEWIFADAEPLITFLNDATGTPEGEHALWSIFDSLYNNSESSDMLKKIMGSDGAGENYIKISIEPSFLRALFMDIDNNGDGVKEEAVAYSIMKLVNLSYVNNDREFMQRILEELYGQTQGDGTSILKTGTEGNNNLILTLGNLLKNITVK
jgi:hypothetical protein